VLVVAYDDGGPAKLVNLYDGYLSCFMNSTVVELTGFRTPAVGAVNAQLSSWCDEYREAHRDGGADSDRSSARLGRAHPDAHRQHAGLELGDMKAKSPMMRDREGIAETAEAMPLLDALRLLRRRQNEVSLATNRAAALSASDLLVNPGAD